MSSNAEQKGKGICPDSTRLIFDRPAADFVEAFPLGNGTLGAMVFGGHSDERIILNEKSMWSGSPADADRPDAFEALPELRKLVFAERHAEAQRLASATFTCQNEGSALGQAKEKPYGCYQIFGNLRIRFLGLPKTETYRRTLDLSRAVALIETYSSHTAITRTVFTSAVDRVLIYRIESSKPKALDFDVSLDRSENATVSVVGNVLTLAGSLPDGKGGEGTRFRGVVSISHDGETDSSASGSLRIRRATVATLYFSAATSTGQVLAEDLVEQTVQRAMERGYEVVLQRHLDEFSAKVHRVALSLPSRTTSLLTPDRIVRCGAGENDPALAALYFHYGRYLALSCSRADDPLPSNLQGIWAEDVQTPWNGDFHLNINLQMNYWPVEVANLAECHRPLLRFIQRLVPNGRKTAAAYYGCRGWVAHMMSNPWGFTSPGEDVAWGSSLIGGAWLCQHLWTHYEFGQDEEYLREVYPVMKEAAEFFLDVLVTDPKTGWLVTCPSSSPENAFLSREGEKVSLCAGPTMDCAIVSELMSHVIEAAGILGCDHDFVLRLEKTREQLPPYQIGRWGQLQEWLEDHEESEITHRHFSHLYGLFPGSDISPRLSTTIAEATRVSLLRRGEESTGWSTAWKACCWARLGDGEAASQFLRKLTSPPPEAGPGLTGGAYPNLFCAHPPFQIDGNFGGTAAVAEMLVQSHERKSESGGSYVVSLLPALPSAWDTGSFSGLRVRGNLEVGARWEQSMLRAITLTSPNARTAAVRYDDFLIEVDLNKGPNHFRWDAEASTFFPETHP